MLDTKLKNNKKYINKILITLAILLTLIPICIFGTVRYLGNGDIYSSDSFREYFNNIYYQAMGLSNIVDNYDGTMKESAIEIKIQDLKHQYKYEYDELKAESQELLEYGYDEWQRNENKSRLKNAEANINKNDYQLREEAVRELRDNISNIKASLNRNINIEFYYETENPEKPITNIEGLNGNDFEISISSGEYNHYILMFGRRGSSGRSGSDVSNSLKNIVDSNETMNYHEYDMYFRIKNELQPGDYIYLETEEYNKSKNWGYGALTLGILVVVLITGILISIRKSDRKIKVGIVITLYRKLFLEVRLVGGIGFIVLMMGLYRMIWWEELGYVISLMIVGIIVGYLVLTDVFKFKELHKNKELTAYCKEKLATNKVYSLIKESTMIKSTKVRVLSSIVFIIAYAAFIACTMFLVFSTWYYGYFEITLLKIGMIVLCVILTLIIITYILKTGQQINKIKIGTDSIVKGNYNNHIDIKGPQVLKDISANVINIEAGLSTAVENAVRSEKMKGELITNVSHDLKTPLTSIINYVDLLDKENVSEEDKEKYIAVLKEKSARLKALIEDLFEASKAASGAMELNMESIDPVALLRQTIGEFEDKIEASGLSFIKRIPEEKLMVYADGRKTFRIFQNLISNILKYSMPNSRVYIEVKEDENKIEIAFKNISEHELDFTEEEILERFKRGDSSRTTEGSGLGLAIAKSLVELQGGSFKLSIDGDLFKATVSLRKGNLEIN